MIGAIAGDIIGSIYEFHPIKTIDFPLFTEESTFTDDTVLTVAVADSLLNNIPIIDALRTYTARHHTRGFGQKFYRWAAAKNPQPYYSFGNGAAMRISPVAAAAQSLDEVLALSAAITEVTHNHPEGIKGAQATAAAIFLARTGSSKAAIKSEIESRFLYDLSPALAGIRQSYAYTEAIMQTVPEALICFLVADSYEATVRNAVSLGGDADTLACIAGSIAEPFFGVPDVIAAEARRRLPPDLCTVVDAFCARFPI